MKNFLRKHGGVIMAVLGIFLMAAFSLPSYLKSGNENNTIPMGTMNGKTVTSAQVSAAKFDLDVLQHFPVIAYRQAAMILNQNNKEVHWYLLQREAAAYGIVPSEVEITEQVSSMGATADQISAALSDMKLSQTELRLAVGHAVAISRLVSMTLDSVPVSVPHMEVFADRRASALQVSYFVLDANVAPLGATPSEDAIKKQFDAYKSVVASSITGIAPTEINAHHYPFGYKYPDRVIVEYIKFDRAWLKDHFKPTNKDFEEAYKYYSTHQSEFADDGGAVATQPAIKPFEKVSNQLLQKQLDDRIGTFLKKVTDTARDLASAPWKDAETEKGFRKGVMDKPLVSYDDIVKAINTNPEYEGFTLTHGTHTDFLDKTGLKALKGIGGAEFATQSAQFSFADMALGVKELDPAPGPTSRLYLQLGVEAPLVQDADGNVYLYRVVKAEKSHEPASVNEVRGQVVADLAKLAAYEAKVADGKAFAAAIAKDGMTAVAGKAQAHVESSDPLHQWDAEKTDAQPAAGFIRAAYQLAGSSATQPAAMAGVTLNDDADLKVYVIGSPSYHPYSPAQFGAERAQILRLSKEDGYIFTIQWLSLDDVAKRLKFVPIEPFKDKEGA